MMVASLFRRATGIHPPTPSGTLATAAAIVALLASPHAAAQDSGSDGETPAAKKDEGMSKKKQRKRVESIADLPRAKKRRLLKLLQSARKDYANGQYEQVVDQMKEAYEIYPDPEFLFRIALSHERTGNKKKAIDYYERYLEAKPDSQKRGRVQRSLGQLRQAIRKEREREEARQEAIEASEGQSKSTAIVLTSIGGVLIGGSVTFGILNLQTRSQLEKVRREGPDAVPQIDSRDDYNTKVTLQNVYAGLTYGTGALGAAGLAWAIYQWTQIGGDGSSENGDKQARGPALDLRLMVGPRSIGVGGRF